MFHIGYIFGYRNLKKCYFSSVAFSSPSGVGWGGVGCYREKLMKSLPDSQWMD